MSNSTLCPELQEAAAISIPVPLNYFIIMFLISLSALFSGLTLGLLGLDKMGLQIVIGGDDLVAAKYAKAILPVRENGNQLLCTLLLGNVSVNSMLSILMADMTSGVVGFLSSTIMIVIFGEIIPQASCSRHALKVGYYSLPVVKFFILVFYFAAYPLGYLLDKLLGDDIGTIHSRTELRKMLELHVKHGAVDVDSGGVMDGALRYRDMMVKEVMTPASEVFMLSIEEKFDYKTMGEIFKAGCSRIPVYGKDRDEIVGLILVKDLLFIDVDDEITIRSFMTHFGRIPPSVWPDQKLGEVLKMFRQGRSHMAIVRDVDNSGPGDPFYTFQGIVTLEDIIEEILGQEINDETDVYVDANDTLREVDSRDMEFARYSLLLHGSSGAKDATLANEEVQAISAHLMGNVPDFKAIIEKCPGLPIGIDEVQDMIRSQCKLVEATRESSIDMVTSMSPAPGDVLYKAGHTATFSILILSGKVTVIAGKEQFRSEVGPWTMLASGSIANAGDSHSTSSYVPDFTAFVSSDTIRYIRIPQKQISALLLRQFSKLASSANKQKQKPTAAAVMHSTQGQTKYSDNLIQFASTDDFVMNPILEMTAQSSKQNNENRNISRNIQLVASKVSTSNYLLLDEENDNISHFV